MRVHADFAAVDGTLRRGVTLHVDGRGVLTHVVHAAGPAPGDRHWPGAVVVPGGIDACALGALAAPLGGSASAASPIPPGSAAARAAAAVRQALGTQAHRASHLDDGQLRAAAEAACARAVRAGITSLALPHLAPQPLPQPTSSTRATRARAPFAAADVVLGAADAVGLRLSLLDVMLLRPPGPAPGAAALWRCAHPSFEAALGHLDALVRHQLQRRSQRNAWGALVALPAWWPADAFVALRLRLAHLPTVVVDAGERLAVPAQLGAAAVGRLPPGPTLQTQLVASGALDACCTLLALGAAAGGAEPEAEAEAETEHADASSQDASVGAGATGAGEDALLRSGTVRLRGPAIVGAAGVEAASRAGWGTASGLGAVGHDEGTWHGAALGRGPRAPSPSRLAASALGLMGGTLRPNTWADFAVLRPRPGAGPLPQALHAVVAALRGAPGATPLVATDVFVAGRALLR